MTCFSKWCTFRSALSRNLIRGWRPNLVVRSRGNKADRKLTEILSENEQDDIYSHWYSNEYTGYQSEIANCDGRSPGHCTNQPLYKPNYEASAASK